MLLKPPAGFEPATTGYLDLGILEDLTRPALYQAELRRLVYF